MWRSISCGITIIYPDETTTNSLPICANNDELEYNSRFGCFIISYLSLGFSSKTSVSFLLSTYNRLLTALLNCHPKMKLNKKPSRISAFLCIVQVCLLSIASVSPQIHTWVFHGGQFADTACSDAHSVCAELSDASNEHESQPDLPEDKDNFCPVILFAQGVTFTDESAISLPEQHPVAVLIAIEPDSVWKSHSEGAVQARAPPIS
ncbi:MAG: hypothetical protein ACJAUA_001003 [Zhongshania aliphaticivorans]